MSQPTSGRCRTGFLRAHGDMVKKKFFKKSKKNVFSTHRYCSEQYWCALKYLFLASITAQISFSANRSTSAKDRYCCESMRFFAIVLRFALKEIWAVIKVKNRCAEYCSEQYRCALKKFFQKISAKKIFFSKFFFDFYIRPCVYFATHRSAIWPKSRYRGPLKTLPDFLKVPCNDFLAISQTSG